MSTALALSVFLTALLTALLTLLNALRVRWWQRRLDDERRATRDRLNNPPRL